MKNLWPFLGINALSFIVLCVMIVAAPFGVAFVTLLAFVSVFCYTAYRFIITPLWLWVQGKPQPTSTSPISEDTEIQHGISKYSIDNILSSIKVFFLGGGNTGKIFFGVLIAVIVISIASYTDESPILSTPTKDTPSISANDTLNNKTSEPYLFMDIPVEGDVDVFVKELKTKKWVTYRESIHGGFLFYYKLLGKELNHIAVMPKPNTNKVKTVGLSTDFIYNWAQLHERYVTYKNVFTGKHGKPYYKEESFNRPYKNGDGDEIEAIRMDKCKYKSIWKLDQGFLQVLILNNCTISVVYTKDI